jgi:enoyl-CoA hydratase/carnithine racemase
MAGYKHITYEIKDGIGWVTLNRPEQQNAMNDEMILDLERMLPLAEMDLDVKVLIFKGAGKSFCSGQDLSGVGTDEVLPPSSKKKPSNKVLMEAARRRNRRWEYIFNIPKPTIAQVQGNCFGTGMYLALACDITIASEDALFADQSLSMGILPEFPLLTWLAGVKRADSMFLLGRKVNAKEAERFGLINRVVPKDKLDSEVLKFAKELCLLHSDALALAKDSINGTMEVRGVGSAWRFTTDMSVMMQQRKRERGEFDFEKTRDSQGLEAALKIRDEILKESL